MMDKEITKRNLTSKDVVDLKAMIIDNTVETAQRATKTTTVVKVRTVVLRTNPSKNQAMTGTDPIITIIIILTKIKWEELALTASMRKH
jgi:hypothetical protein